MTQQDFGNLASPLSGTNFFDNKLEPWRDSLHSSHSGTSRPSYAAAGMLWMDTSATPWRLKMFDGTDDIVAGSFNISTNVFTPAGIILNNITATTAPTVNEDSGDGYSAGSLWVNLTTDLAYICVDAGVGAASWRQLVDTTTSQALSGKSFASITVTGGSITGITDLAVADGGTGSSTASGARANLGAAASGANTDITSLAGCALDGDCTIQGYRPSVTYTANTVAGLTDGGKCVLMNVASANTYTLPSNVTAAIPVGTEIDLIQVGAGQTTIVAGSGATASSAQAYLKVAYRYGGVTMKKTSTNGWIVMGGLAA